MKKLMIASLAAALSLGSLTVQADQTEDAIKYRQGVFDAMKWHFGAMAAMVKGKKDYDAKQFSHHAQSLALLSTMPEEGFIAGSDKGKTSAKPEIWAQPDKFKQRMQALVDSTAELAHVAEGGDMARIKPAFGKVGMSCKGCHDNFREKH